MNVIIGLLQGRMVMPVEQLIVSDNGEHRRRDVLQDACLNDIEKRHGHF